MKRLLFLLLVAGSALLMSCEKEKEKESFTNIGTPRTSVPEELVGRWAITSISGSTVYDIPAGTTFNTSEVFLGYQINKDGTTREDGYASTYSYGNSTWAKWTAYGSVQMEGSSISFHRARGTYTSSRSSTAKAFGAAEVYPNKTFDYVEYAIEQDNRGRTMLLLIDADGGVHTYYKQ